MSLIDWDGSDREYELWSGFLNGTDTRRGVSVRYPLINIPMFNGSIEYVVGDDTLLLSRALSGGWTTSGWAIEWSVEVKFRTPGEGSGALQMRPSKKSWSPLCLQAGGFPTQT